MSPPNGQNGVRWCTGSLPPVPRRLVIVLLRRRSRLAAARSPRSAWATRDAGSSALPDPLRPQTPAFPISRCPRSPRSRRARAEGRPVHRVHRRRVATSAPGPLIVHAVRADRTRSLAGVATLSRARGSTSERVTPGNMVWGGHGHDHWHVHIGRVLLDDPPGSTEPFRATTRSGSASSTSGRLVEQPPDRARPRRVPEDRMQRRGHARVHDGPLPRLGGPVHLDASRPAAARERTRGRRLSPLGQGRPRRLVPRDERAEQPHLGRPPPDAVADARRRSRSSAAGPRARPPGSRAETSDGALRPRPTIPPRPSA